MVNIQGINKSTYIVSSPSPKYEGVVIHGYGGNKEEILGLAIHLATNLDSKICVFDLPGHGHQENQLNLKNALASLSDALKTLDNPSFAVGHSLGARLALMRELSVVTAISPPLDVHFEGNRKDLLRVMRTRRVKEESPFSGSDEIISQDCKLAEKTLLLKADQELATVNSFCEKWQDRNIDCHKIKNTSHLDIISAPLTIELTCNWLRENLL